MLTEIRKVRPESPKQFVLIKRKKNHEKQT